MGLVRHLVHQRAMLGSLAGVALRAVLPRVGANGEANRFPGPELCVELPPPSPSLIRDYVLHVGGDVTRHAGTIPPHFFPQLSMPLAAETLRGSSYPIYRIMNAGCRLEIRAPLVLGERLLVRAQLENVDDDGRRAVLRQRIVVGQRSAEEALVAHVHAVVPLARRTADRDRKRRPEPARVPPDAEQIEALELKSSAGLDFALLTGDLNPVHWVRPYARALGHRGTVLHGFASMARMYEALDRAHCRQPNERVRMLDVRFVRPLVLPVCVGVFREGEAVYVGRRGEPAFVTGSYAAGVEQLRAAARNSGIVS